MNPSVPLALILATGVTFSSCASEPIDPGAMIDRPSTSLEDARHRPALGDTVRIPIGETAASTDGTLLVAFGRVNADSRCPIDVVCVWSGDAEAVIGTAPVGGRWSWSVLHTDLEPQSIVAFSHTVTLLYLEPANQVARPLDPADYVAVMTITPD